MEGVLRRGPSLACHTRLVVSMLIMSDDAKSDRPQVVAIGCRCMNSSTAWQAWLRRRSSRAQPLQRHDKHEERQAVAEHSQQDRSAQRTDLADHAARNGGCDWPAQRHHLEGGTVACAQCGKAQHEQRHGDRERGVRRKSKQA